MTLGSESVGGGTHELRALVHAGASTQRMHTAKHWKFVLDPRPKLDACGGHCRIRKCRWRNPKREPFKHAGGLQAAGPYSLLELLRAVTESGVHDARRGGRIGERVRNGFGMRWCW